MEQTQQFDLILGGHQLPLDIQSLAAGGTGAAAPRSFGFRFAYRQIPLSVRFEEQSDSAILEITGTVGPMPFSAESAEARTNLLYIIDAANARLSDPFKVVDGQIRVSASMRPERPLTAVGLLRAITVFLVPVKPYLETIEVFLSPPGETHRTGEGALRAGWRRGARLKRNR
jgi:hypothetical protein